MVLSVTAGSWIPVTTVSCKAFWSSMVQLANHAVKLILSIMHWYKFTSRFSGGLAPLDFPGKKRFCCTFPTILCALNVRPKRGN